MFYTVKLTNSLFRQSIFLLLDVERAKIEDGFLNSMTGLRLTARSTDMHEA